jgi:hypothetical protein
MNANIDSMNLMQHLTFALSVNISQHVIFLKNIGTACGLNCPFSFNLCYLVEYTYYIYIVQ